MKVKKQNKTNTVKQNTVDTTKRNERTLIVSSLLQLELEKEINIISLPIQQNLTIAPVSASDNPNLNLLFNSIPLMSPQLELVSSLIPYSIISALKRNKSAISYSL